MDFDAQATAKAAIGRIELKRLQGWVPMGTGFVVGERTVLTAMHVVADRSAPGAALLGELRFVRNGSRVPFARLSGHDSADDWALLELAESAGVAPLAVSSAVPAEQYGWWTFGYPKLNEVEGVPAHAELRDPNAVFDRGTAISLVSQDLKGTETGGLSGAPLLRGQLVHGIVRADLAAESRNLGYLYATAIQRVLDRADLRSAQPNPYQGMRPFDEGRADYFFGRDREAGELVDRLRASRLALLQGGSGSGKSSLLRAGLLPRVRAGQLAGGAAIDTVVFQPRMRPLHELALALAPRLSFPGRPVAIGDLRAAFDRGDTALSDLVDQELHHRHQGDRSRGGLLIVVDQLEELYAGDVDREEARRLLPLLCAAAASPDGRVWVAGAVRDGFMEELLGTSPQTETLRRALVAVGPIASLEGLRELIVRPAEKAGLRFAPADLPEQIAKDAGEVRGSLPLLQYALDRLWQERKGDTLVGDAYRAFGKVEGVIAHHAQATLDALNEDSQLAKRLFLRLVWVRPDGPNTRRLLPHEALHALPPEAVELAYKFVTARLLVESAHGIEIAHEALIREWAPLREWVESAPEGELRLQQIEQANARWVESKEKREELLPAHRLRPLAEWAFRNSLDVPPAERRFLLENLLATEWRAEEWVPRFPAAEVERALARPGRTAEEELRLLSGLYASRGGKEYRAVRLAALVRGAEGRELGIDAGRLAVEHEGAAWLVAEAGAPVITGLLNDKVVQQRVREALPRAGRRPARAAAALQLAWEQRTKLLLVAASVFVAVWFFFQVWRLVDPLLQMAGLVSTASLGLFSIVNLPLWAAAGAYLDERSAILDRPLTRRELWSFTAAVALSEVLLSWLSYGLRSVLVDKSSLEALRNAAAELGSFLVTAILLMPAFTDRAAVSPRRRRWLRLGIATLASVAVAVYLRRSGRLDEDLTNLGIHFTREYLTVLVAAFAALWARRGEWRPSLGAATARRRLGRAVLVVAGLLVLAVLGTSRLLPYLLTPDGLAAYAARLDLRGQRRGAELLWLACDKGQLVACRTLAQRRSDDADGRAMAMRAAEKGCRGGDSGSCETWIFANPRPDLEATVVACERTGEGRFCDRALNAVVRQPGTLAAESWRDAAHRLCEASVARACAALAEATQEGTWLPQNLALAGDYRRRACSAGLPDLCSGTPAVGEPSPAAVEECRTGSGRACESLPATAVLELAKQQPPASYQRMELLRLACEGGADEACVSFGKLRSRQRRFVSSLAESVPEGIEIPGGFQRRRLYPSGEIVEDVVMPWESAGLELVPDDNRLRDLEVDNRGGVQRFLESRYCDASAPAAFTALLALPAPLPENIPAAASAVRAAGLGRAWSLLDRQPPATRSGYADWCGELKRSGAQATSSVLPTSGGTYLLRSSQPGIHDVLAELRTWPLPDRSVLVAWRVLRTWPAPFLPPEGAGAP